LIVLLAFPAVHAKANAQSALLLIAVMVPAQSTLVPAFPAVAAQVFAQLAQSLQNKQFDKRAYCTCDKPF